MNRSHAQRPTALQKRDLEKCAEALNLRLGGMSYRAIADAQACDVSTAHDRVQRALRSIVPTEKVEELRQIENERLNAAVTACLEVLGGTQTITIDEREVELPYGADERLAAVGRLTKLSERIAKLNGLDVPVVQKVEAEVTHLDLTDAELRRLARELADGAEAAAAGVPREAPQEP